MYAYDEKRVTEKAGLDIWCFVLLLVRFARHDVSGGQGVGMLYPGPRLCRGPVL